MAEIGELDIFTLGNCRDYRRHAGETRESGLGNILSDCLALADRSSILLGCGKVRNGENCKTCDSEDKTTRLHATPPALSRRRKDAACCRSGPDGISSQLRVARH